MRSVAGLGLLLLLFPACDFTQNLGGTGGNGAGGGGGGGASTTTDSSVGGGGGMVSQGGGGTGSEGGGGAGTGGSGAGNASTEWAISNLSGNAAANDVSVDANGHIAVVGHSESPVDFGAGPLPFAGGTDAFLAVFDRNANLLWNKVFGGAAFDDAISVASDSTGNILIAATFGGTVDFGTGPLVAAGPSDLALAKYDASGAPLWSKRIGTLGNLNGAHVAFDLAGNILVGGTFATTINFGSGSLSAAGPNGSNAADSFIARLDPNGLPLWVKTFGDADSGVLDRDEINDVAVDPADHILIAGAYNGTFSVGGPALASGGLRKAWVAKLDPAGNHEWSKSFGEDKAGASAVAATPDGGVAFTGVYFFDIDFGGNPSMLTPYEQIFLAKLDANGAYVYSQQIDAPPGSSLATCAGANAAGEVGIAGFFEGTINMGADDLTAWKSDDWAFYGKYGTDGALLLQGAYGVPSPKSDILNILSKQAWGMAYDPSTSHVVLAGLFVDKIDFGLGEIATPEPNGHAMFLARLAP